MTIGIKTNLENLAEDIGAYLGMAEGIEQKQYMDELLEGSHRKTVPEFVAAAAKSAKTLNFTHMYEYGVAGITRGDKQFINPLLPNARLWTNVMVGNGGRKNITFMFREATRRVPKHTTESTGGVDQDELDKLKLNQGKRYVFREKAEIFEQGIDLNIHPKQREGRLFVPLRGTSFKVSSKDEARGFTWARKVHINPGEMSGSTGQFNFFFFEWWTTFGAQRFAQHMEAQVTENIRQAEAVVGSNRVVMKSPKTTNIAGATQRGKQKTRKQFTVWASREEGMKEVIL